MNDDGYLAILILPPGAQVASVRFAEHRTAWQDSLTVPNGQSPFVVLEPPDPDPDVITEDR